MSDTALQMHADFNRGTRQSARFSLVAICIAAASFVVTALFSWWSYRDAQVRDAEAQRARDAYQAQISTIMNQQDTRLETLIQALRADAAIHSRQERQALIEALSEALRAAREVPTLEAPKEDKESEAMPTTTIDPSLTPPDGLR